MSSSTPSGSKLWSQAKSLIHSISCGTQLGHVTRRAQVAEVAPLMLNLTARKKSLDLKCETSESELIVALMSRATRFMLLFLNQKHLGLKKAVIILSGTNISLPCCVQTAECMFLLPDVWWTEEFPSLFLHSKDEYPAKISKTLTLHISFRDTKYYISFKTALNLRLQPLIVKLCPKHLQLLWCFGPAGPRKFMGFENQTVGRWSRSSQKGQREIDFIIENEQDCPLRSIQSRT